jgi:hypothetical protein
MTRDNCKSEFHSCLGLARVIISNLLCGLGDDEKAPRQAGCFLGFLVPVCVCLCVCERETNVLLVGTFFQHSLGNVAISLERCLDKRLALVLVGEHIRSLLVGKVISFGHSFQRMEERTPSWRWSG